MNGAAINRQRGLFNGLIQSWMTMTGAGNIFSLGTKSHGGGAFMDHRSSLMTDNMNAKNLVGF